MRKLHKKKEAVIYTNNSAVAAYFENLHPQVKWFNTPAVEVLAGAKSAAQLGCIILSSLTTGINASSRFEFKPSETKTSQKIRTLNPFLSILVSCEQKTVDFDSVKNADEVLATYKRNARLRYLSHNDEEIRLFQAIDLQHLTDTITALEKMGILT